MFIDLENPLKVTNITILGLIVQVLLQYKVAGTPELGPSFRGLRCVLVLPVEGVSDCNVQGSELLPNVLPVARRSQKEDLVILEALCMK